MDKDPIVEEIHQIREEYSKKLDNDLHKICEAIRQEQQQDDRKTVTRASRKAITQPKAA